MADRGEIVALEQVAMAAQPALESAVYDGWVLRFSQGYTRRANSVHPLHFSTLAVEGKIDHCATAFAERGLPLIFKMTSAAEPGLDAALERRGLTVTATTSVQVCSLDGPGNGPAHPCTLAAEAGDDWLDAFCRLAGVAPERRPVLTRMLGAIATPAAYASIAQDGEPVAVGLGVVVDAWVGLFDIATAPDRRRRGLARSLVASLLAWGRDEGAAAAYLQVMVDNDPALALYRSFGFTELYRYWYRS